MPNVVSFSKILALVICCQWVMFLSIKLSGGQRQRIAIARAILKDAPILILDEAARQGYTLKIFDTFRPKKAAHALWEGTVIA